MSNSKLIQGLISALAIASALLIIAAFVLSGVAWANYPVQQSVLLDAGTSAVILHNTGAAGDPAFNPPINFGPGASQRVRLTLTPINVKPASGTTFSALTGPLPTMNINLNSDAYIWPEIVDNSGNPLSPPRVGQRLVVRAIPSPCVAAGSWTFPIMVVGQDNFTQCVQVNNTSGITTGLVLYARLHNTGYLTAGLGTPSSATKYDGKVSVQINGTYYNLNCTNIVEIDENRFYGPNDAGDLPGSCTVGNAYGPRTLEITLAIPDNLVTSGTNSIRWRFNGTDGNTSGFRVLAFNFLQAAKACTQYVVTSNVTVATCNSNGWSNGDWVRFYTAPGMYSRFNGARHLTAVSTNTATFAPCGGTVNTILAGACTSPDGTYTYPTSQLLSYESQPASYGAKQIIPESAFSWEDPTTWTAGSGNATNGATLFKQGTGSIGNGNLVIPNLPNLANNLTTFNCAVCHDTQGRDLKYFNFSNASIIARSVFHGLTESQGADIAAYIRGLSVTVPAVARPWNPPYFPGPGLDAGTLNDWAAGSGIDVQLTYDRDLREYYGPPGFANLAPAQSINGRQLPMMWQGQDWEQWLPPLPFNDFVPATNFFGSQLYSDWITARDGITPGSFSSWQSNGGGYAVNFLAFNNLDTNYRSSVQAYNNPNNNLNPSFDNPSQWPMVMYSISQWSLVKTFELMHFYGLEGMADQYRLAVNGSCSVATTVARNWSVTQIAFTDGLHYQTGIPPQNSVPARKFATFNYQTNAVYIQAFGMETGNKWLTDHIPIDFPYLGIFIRAVGTYRGSAYESALHWIGGIQDQWCNPLPTDDNGGLNLNSILPVGVLGSANGAAFLLASPTDTTEIFTQYATQWVAMINRWTTAQWQTWTTATAGTGMCTSENPFATPALNGSFSAAQYCDQVAFALPMLRYFGVPAGLLTSIQNWAAAIWNGNVIDNGGGFGGVPVNWSHQTNAVCLPNTDPNLIPWPVCSNAVVRTGQFNISAGTNTVTVGFPLIGVGGLLTIGSGGNQENVTVTAQDGAGNITFTNVNAHTAPYRILGAM